MNNNLIPPYKQKVNKNNGLNVLIFFFNSQDPITLQLSILYLFATPHFRTDQYPCIYMNKPKV